MSHADAFSPPFRRASIAVVIALAVVSSAAPGHARDGVITSALRDALTRDGKLSVCVRLAPVASSAPAVSGAPSGAGSHAHSRIQAEFAASMPADAARVVYRFRFSPIVSVIVGAPRGLDALEDSPLVSEVSLDMAGGASLDDGRALTLVDEAREEFGISGDGTVVATLDTGINLEHEDVRDAALHHYHFLEQGEDTGPGGVDDSGHGSHIEGIIASQGLRAPLGVAPGALIVGIKVLNREAKGFITDWTAGLEYVISLHERAAETGGSHEPGRVAERGVWIDVVNMSLATQELFEGRCDDAGSVALDAFNAACEAAVERGIVLVGAAGNDVRYSAMASPACFSSVIAVGSTKDTDASVISLFSNRSEELDLLAPGENIDGVGPGRLLVQLSGTSQATAHISGIVSLLREAQPDISPERVRELLVATATPVWDRYTSRNYPFVNALEALSEIVIPSVVELQCSFDPVSGRAEVQWMPEPRADGFLVEISSSGNLVSETLVSADATGYSEGDLPDGDYDVCVSAFRSGEMGRESCCDVTVREQPVFVRTDCNDDGDTNISDSIRLLTGLFGDMGEFDCPKACDSNDDGGINVSDAIYSLNFLFRDGTPPPTPFPGCGADHTTDVLGCEASFCRG